MTWFLALTSIALGPGSARGQAETPKIAEMKIDLWPEYDRAAALVMYRFRLGASSDLSVPVAVPLPTNVEEIHAVAWADPKGSLFSADFTRRVEADRAVVLARLGSREGQLEFYTDIEFDDRGRSFQFVWPGGVEVEALSFQIQRPASSSEFHVTPAPSREWKGEDGLTYVLVELGPQTASARPSIEVEYKKDGAALSAPAASSPSPAASVPRTEARSPTPWWLIAAGGLVLGALGAVVLGSLRGRDKATVKSNDTIFCHQCGAEGRRTHSFCMNCGTRLLTK